MLRGRHVDLPTHATRRPGPASATVTYMIRYRCTYGQIQADTCASWDVTFTAAPSPVFWSTVPAIGPR